MIKKFAILFALLASVSVAQATQVRTSSDGTLTITDDAGATVVLSGGKAYVNGTDVHVGDDGTGDLILSATKTVFMKFVANEPQNWAGTPPVYVWDALQRLASACARLGVKP